MSCGHCVKAVEGNVGELTGVSNVEVRLDTGASNTTILLGWKYGIIVALIDICKAVFPVIMVQILGPYYGASEQLIHTLMYVGASFLKLSWLTAPYFSRSHAFESGVYENLGSRRW